MGPVHWAVDKWQSCVIPISEIFSYNISVKSKSKEKLLCPCIPIVGFNHAQGTNGLPRMLSTCFQSSSIKIHVVEKKSKNVLDNQRPGWPSFVILSWGLMLGYSCVRHDCQRHGEPMWAGLKLALRGLMVISKVLWGTFQYSITVKAVIDFVLIP